MKAHWERVYATRASEDVSWYEAHPRASLRLISACALPSDAAIIDVGGGDSRLMDHLLDAGYTRLTVVDISGEALRRAQHRLGERAEQVTWMEADALDLPPCGPFDLWHDRVMFHFLVEAAHRERYLANLSRTLRPGGFLILATFALSGPPKCSGLDVKRYGPEELRGELGGTFQLVESFEEVHVTPGGVRQPFFYSRWRRA